MKKTSTFVFALCQVGAETALKAEVARLHAGLRPAFARPGFLTFKSDAERDLDFDLGAVLARVSGLSIGQGGVAEAAAAARELAEGGVSVRLHLAGRDRFAPGEEPQDYDPTVTEARLAALEAAIRAEAAGALLPGAEAQVGDLVLDVIELEEDGKLWLGVHHHDEGLMAWPSGRAPLSLPKDAPSRAWLKLEEVLLWSGAPLEAGDAAVEIGSAPGGASWALLGRGLRVVGIDPGAMDARVAAHPNFEHVSKPASAVEREDLPEKAEWLLLDVNVEPALALRAAARIERLLTSGQPGSGSLLGVILTLKLNRPDIAFHAKAFLAEVAEMGVGPEVLRAAQLSTHRREFVVYGLTRKGLRRWRKK